MRELVERFHRALRAEVAGDQGILFARPGSAAGGGGAQGGREAASTRNAAERGGEGFNGRAPGGGGDRLVAMGVLLKLERQGVTPPRDFLDVRPLSLHPDSNMGRAPTASARPLFS